MSENRIFTEQDRREHIQECKQRDRDTQGLMGRGHYENVGDLATFNTNVAHNNQTGFDDLLPDTPEWIIKLAIERGWWVYPHGTNAENYKEWFESQDHYFYGRRE